MKSGKGIWIVLIAIVGIAVWASSQKQDQKPEGDAVSPKEMPASKSELADVLNEKATVKDRTKALAKTSDSLSVEELEKLRPIWTEPLTDAKLRAGTTDVLLKQKKNFPTWFVSDAAKMAGDTKESSGWRLSCMLALEQVVGRIEDKTELTAAAKRLSKTDDSVVATESLKLLGMLASTDKTAAAELQGLTQEAIAEAKASPRKAAEALHLARETNDTSVLKQARQIAADAGQDLVVRKTAIETLGEIGTKSDLALIQKLAKDKDATIRRVAGYCAKRLAKKLAAGSPG